MFKPTSRYDEFIKAFCGANSHLPKAEQYSKGQKLWNELKKDNQKVQAEILKLKGATSKKRSINIASFMNLSEAAPKVPKHVKAQEAPTEKKTVVPETVMVSEDT